jgi:hypothetical protein
VTTPSPLTTTTLQQVYALTRKREKELNGAATTVGDAAVARMWHSGRGART